MGAVQGAENVAWYARDPQADSSIQSGPIGLGHNWRLCYYRNIAVQTQGVRMAGMCE